MGVVYRAVDPKLNRTVAIKVLPSSMLSSDEDRSRFYREARAAAALSHPNIATVYAIDEAVPEGSGEDDLRPFIAMEYIDGPSLDQKIAESPLRLKEVVSVAHQVASALQMAHEHDIVHRDIKSANIMVTDKGVVKILDFGLAKTAQSTKLTQMGATLGTAAYMSPEQTRGEEVDGRADLWSLGVVMYEMIAGKLPFHGDYEQAVIFEILNQNPEPLTAIRTGVPMALEQLVDKLLEKDLELRYQSAADVIADLKRLEISLADELDSRKRVAPTATKVRPSGRGKAPGVRAVYGLGALVLVVAGALGAWMIGGMGMSSPPEALSSPPIHLNLLLPDSAVYDDAHWSPDGTKILFSADYGDRKGYVVEYDLTTGKLEEMTDANMNLWPFPIRRSSILEDARCMSRT
jgi:serine/threonine protein kinase